MTNANTNNTETTQQEIVDECEVEMTTEEKLEGTPFEGSEVTDVAVIVNKNDYLNKTDIDVDHVIEYTVEEMNISVSPHQSKEQQEIIYKFVADMVNAELEKTVFSNEWSGGFLQDLEELIFEYDIEQSFYLSRDVEVNVCDSEDVEEYLKSLEF